MKNQRKSTPTNGGLKAASVFILAGFALVAGVFAYVKVTPMDDGKKAQTVEQTQPDESKSDIENVKPTKATTVDVQKPTYEGDELQLHPTKERVPAGQNRYLAAINGFLKNSGHPGKALSALVEGDVLVVNLSNEYNEGLSSEDETTLVNGIIATAKQFPKVNSVRFMVNGERVDTFGHLDLTQDTPVRD